MISFVRCSLKKFFIQIPIDKKEIYIFQNEISFSFQILLEKFTFHLYNKCLIHHKKMFPRFSKRLESIVNSTGLKDNE